MAKKQRPKWQQEIEVILKKQQDESGVGETVKIFDALLEIVKIIDIPEGNDGSLIQLMLSKMSQELYPLAIAMAGFQLGIAWERYQRERSSGKS